MQPFTGSTAATCWHYSHSIWQGLCNDTVSVYPSVPSCTSATACGRFTAVGPRAWDIHWKWKLPSSSSTTVQRSAANVSSVTFTADGGSWTRDLLSLQLSTRRRECRTARWTWWVEFLPARPRSLARLEWERSSWNLVHSLNLLVIQSLWMLLPGLLKHCGKQGLLLAWLVLVPVMFNYSVLIGGRSIVMTVSVCLSVFVYLWSYLWPSVLWHCWLGGRKGIRPVKKWVVGCWRGYLFGVRCRLAYGPADATATHCLLLR